MICSMPLHPPSLPLCVLSTPFQGGCPATPRIILRCPKKLSLSRTSFSFLSLRDFTPNARHKKTSHRSLLFRFSRKLPKKTDESFSFYNCVCYPHFRQSQGCMCTPFLISKREENRERKKTMNDNYQIVSQLYNSTGTLFFSQTLHSTVEIYSRYIRRF